MTDPQLSPEEDAELRLLHGLKGFGAVAHTVSTRYNALRGRDRRAAVREPDEDAVATPIAKKMWGDKPSPLTDRLADGPMPDGRPDTREVIAPRGDGAKRGLFRR